MQLSELPEFDVMALKDLDDPFGAIEWERYPDGLARSSRGLEVLGYDKVGQAYRSTDLRNSTAAKMAAIGFSEGPVFEALTGMVTNAEGEEHRRMRRAFQPWFVADSVEKFRSEIRSFIDDWMERNSDGRADFANELGLALPSMVFTQIVGADRDQAPFISHASTEILRFASFNPEVHDGVERAMLETLSWLEALIAQKESSPGSDLTSALLQAEREGTITRNHTVRILVTLIIGSTESTRAQMACNLVALARNKDQWRALQQHPNDLHTAVQELYRYNPATLATARAPERDIEFYGIPVRADEPVFLCRFSANNDPSVYDRPRELNVLKLRERPPFTFGNGRHSCVGRMIATIEQEELLGSALAHWSDFEIADVEWAGFPFMQSPKRLTFEVTSR